MSALPAFLPPARTYGALALAVLDAVDAAPWSTAAEIGEVVNATTQNASHALARLWRGGQIQRRGDGRARPYQYARAGVASAEPLALVPPSVQAEHTRAIAARDAAVREVVEAHALLDTLGAPRRTGGRPASVAERVVSLGRGGVVR